MAVWAARSLRERDKSSACCANSVTNLACRCSACFRSLISVLVPNQRTTRPSESLTGITRVRNMRKLPSAPRNGNSISKGVPVAIASSIVPARGAVLRDHGRFASPNPPSARRSCPCSRTSAGCTRRCVRRPRPSRRVAECRWPSPGSAPRSRATHLRPLTVGNVAGFLTSTITPLLSLIGEIVAETSIFSPPLRTRPFRNAPRSHRA